MNKVVTSFNFPHRIEVMQKLKQSLSSVSGRRATGKSYEICANNIVKVR